MLHNSSGEFQETTEENEPQNRYGDVKVAVLGASGFIGRWVARALCAEGASVYLIVRNEVAAEGIFQRYGIRGKIVEADLSDFEVVGNLFKEIRPSITFNLVGYGVDRSECDEKTAYQINAHLIGIICEAVKQIKDPDWRGQDLVHIGSALEYGAIGGNLAEESIPNPTTLYGKSKLAGTELLMNCCKVARIKGLTARLFTVYGPGEHGDRLLPLLLAAAVKRTPLSLTAGNQRRDFTHVEDVAEGLLRLGLAAARPGEVVNLATGKLTSVRGFAEAAAKTLHFSDGMLRFGALPTRPEEMEHSEVSVRRLRQIIAWTPPTGIAEGILKTWEFQGKRQGGS